MRVGDPLWHQTYYRVDLEAANVLDKLRVRYMTSPTRDALWDGAYSLRKQAAKRVETAQRIGGLLMMFTEDKP